MHAINVLCDLRAQEAPSGPSSPAGESISKTSTESKLNIDKIVGFLAPPTSFAGLSSKMSTF